MAAAPTSSRCTFEPNHWRPNVCKICFEARAAHSPDVLTSSSSPEPRPRVRAVSSPVVHVPKVSKVPEVQPSQSAVTHWTAASPSASASESCASERRVRKLSARTFGFGLDGSSECESPPSPSDDEEEEDDEEDDDAAGFGAVLEEEEVDDSDDGSDEQEDEDAPAGGRSGLLASIRGGVSLRETPAEVKRRPVNKGLDMSSELAWRLRRRQRSQQREVRSRLDDMLARERRAEMDNLVSAINFKHHGGADAVQGLMERCVAFEQSLEVTREVLAESYGWPGERLNALELLCECYEQLDFVLRAAEELSDDVIGASVLQRHLSKLIKCVMRWDHGDLSRVAAAMPDLPCRVREGALGERVRHAAAKLLTLLFDRAFEAHESLSSGHMLKFDRSSRANRVHELLRSCCEARDQLEQLEMLSDGDNNLYERATRVQEELLQEYHEAITVRQRMGHWDRARSSSGAVEDEVPPEVKAAVSSVRDGSFDAAALQDAAWLTPAALFQLSRAAIANKNASALGALCSLPISSDEDRGHWLGEAVGKKWNEGVRLLLDHGSVNINARSRDGGLTPLHRAARRGNLKLMAELIRRGADPLCTNASQHTSLRVLAIKYFPAGAAADSASTSEPSPFSSWLDNPSLSDITLVLDSGETIYAHRIVLAAHSPVFSAMFDSGRFAESEDEEVPLPDIQYKVLRALLEWVYTRHISFLPADTDFACKLLSAAARFMLDGVRDLVEQRVLKHVHERSVGALYVAASSCGAGRLLARARHFFLRRYEAVVGHVGEGDAKDMLLHILDEAVRE